MDAQQFLLLYKEYEGLLREHGKDYKDEEEHTDSLSMGRMRMLRQMRNYLSHNNDMAFLAISDAQGKFLSQLIREETLAGDIVKNHLFTPKRAACTEQSAISSVMAKMAKEKATHMAVTDGKKVLGIVDIFKLGKLACKNPDALLCKETYGAYGKGMAFVPPEMPAAQAAAFFNPVICCTEDGTKDGKFLGIFKP